MLFFRIYSFSFYLYPILNLSKFVNLIEISKQASSKGIINSLKNLSNTSLLWLENMIKKYKK